MKNPLLDIEFLNELHNHRQREVFARITLLNQNEMPIEYIEGRVTAGSINVDGSSALRRTCNLTMILKDQSEINQFYWTFKSKFKLEVGLKNMIDLDYPDIIWFPQGVFILTACNMNQTTNNYTITINGKDKMCKLNGDLGGNISASTDFGTIEEVDAEGNITYAKLLLKDIIREILMNQGGELAENIIINDLDEAGLELMEYRYEEPLYLFRRVSDGTVNQLTLNGEMKVKVVNGKETALKDFEKEDFATTSDLILNTQNAKVVYLQNQSGGWNTNEEYHMIRYEYGDLAGYRLTDLTYAGELKANIGETIVSILDKIKNMLGHFEYFYNLDGRFVFQKKKTYISVPWGASEDSENSKELDLITDTAAIINLTDAKLTTSFANNPNLLNVKNDFSVWGTYKSISGADIPIHMRYAIDKKPTTYTSIQDGKIYNNNKWDWRELIYQMALDYYKCGHDEDFAFRMMEKNPWTIPTGRTGYEQYYTDIQGFWRLLYNPNPEAMYEEIESTKIDDATGVVYIDQPYAPFLSTEKAKLKKELEDWVIDSTKELSYSPDDFYIIRKIDVTTSSNQIVKRTAIYPFVGSNYCCLESDTTYYYSKNGTLTETGDTTILNAQPLNALYQRVGNSDTKRLVVYQRLIEGLNNSNLTLYTKNSEKKKLDEINSDIKKAYKADGSTWKQTMYRWNVADNYGGLSTDSETAEKITYLEENVNGEYYGAEMDHSYWSKSVFESPNALLFWFDFLDAEGSELYDKYCVRVIGDRTKAINDTNVKSIYYRDVPNIVFQKSLADSQYDRQSGYTYIQIPDFYQSLFSISGRGKSAKERIDELIQDHSYCIEATSITTVPLYHLEPNTKIMVKDDMSKINGEYIIQKVTVPLAYNGTMNLTANKVVSNIM